MRLLAGGGAAIRVLDDLSSGRREYLDGCDLDFVAGSLSDSDLLRRSLRGVRQVVHLAAQTSVAGSLADPCGTASTNVLDLVRLLSACVDAGVERFVLASSSAAAGGVDSRITPDRSLMPASPYGASKLAGEAFCSAFRQSYGLATVVLRFANVYGPYSSHKASVVHTFVRQSIAGRPLSLRGDGTQTRDFIYVHDVCRAIMLALGPDAGSEPLQIGTGRETSLLNLIAGLERVARKRLAVARQPGLEGEVARSFTDCRAARERLGFVAQTSLAAGLSITYAWYLAQGDASAGSFGLVRRPRSTEAALKMRGTVRAS